MTCGTGVRKVAVRCSSSNVEKTDLQSTKKRRKEEQLSYQQKFHENPKSWTIRPKRASRSNVGLFGAHAVTLRRFGAGSGRSGPVQDRSGRSGPVPRRSGPVQGDSGPVRAFRAGSGPVRAVWSGT